MDRVEKMLELLRADVQDLKAMFGRQADLPRVLTPRAAAKELSISIWTLRDMMKARTIATCTIGKHKGVPRSEIERLSEPSGSSRRGGGRPKTQKYSARSEIQKLEELQAKKRTKKS